MRFDRMEQYLSVHVAAWNNALQPHLAVLLELGSERGDRPSPKENAHASAASLMAVLLADAVATRAAYMLWEMQGLASSNPSIASLTANQRDAPDLIRRLIDMKHPSAPTRDAVDEIYAVRAVLAHNYVWEVQFGESDDPPDLRIMKATLTDVFGNGRYRQVVDGRFSRRLRLNLVPDLINRTDAGTVLGVACQVVSFLGTVRWAGIPPQTLRPVRVGRRLVPLEEIARRLESRA